MGWETFDRRRPGITGTGMRRDLSTFLGSTYDLLVIGAGIHGTCVAWDAAPCGLSVDSGAPVLATRLRMHIHVLDDRTAYLEPEAEALGDGLAELLRNPVLRERLPSEAKAYVQQEFTPEAAQRKLNSSYSMMESKARGVEA